MSVERFLLTVVEARGVRSNKAGSSLLAFTTAARAGVRAISLPPRSGCAQRVLNHAIMEQKCASLRTSAVTDRVGTKVTRMAYQAAGWK